MHTWDWGCGDRWAVGTHRPTSLTEPMSPWSNPHEEQERKTWYGPLVSLCVSKYVNLCMHALMFTLNADSSGPFQLLARLLCRATLHMLTHVSSP